MASIKDIAAQAGVSVPTVYKVFSSTYSTSDEVREKVYRAAESVGYVVKAEGPRTSDNRLVAIVLDEIVNPFYSAMVQELDKELSHMGYRTTVMYNLNNGQREKDIFDLLPTLKLDGAIFIPSADVNQESIKKLAMAQFPMVQLFRPVNEGLDTVLIDDEQGTYLAIQHLLQSGHTRIMLISKTNPVMLRREVGYTRAFHEAGLEVDERYLYLMNYASNVKEMVKDRIKALSPTAILSVGEMTSVSVIQSLKELNLSIPEDVSLIIYDDLAWTATYGITTVGHSYEMLGRLTTELFDARYKARSRGETVEPTRLMLDPRLISRASVRILPNASQTPPIG